MAGPTSSKSRGGRPDHVRRGGKSEGRASESEKETKAAPSN